MATGFGSSPIGSSTIGYGVPTTINSSAAKVYIKADGTQGNCAKINPLTGDYMIDENGNSIGDDSINQMVYLAYNTLFNSSTVNGFGFDVNIHDLVINEQTKSKVKLAAMKAVTHLTSKNIITIISVIVKKITATGLEVKIEWMNNSTGEINELTF